MAKRGQSAARLRALRKKYGLGEFKKTRKKSAKRTTIRKRAVKKRSNRSILKHGPRNVLESDKYWDLKEGLQR